MSAKPPERKNERKVQRFKPLASMHAMIKKRPMIAEISESLFLVYVVGRQTRKRSASHVVCNDSGPVI